MECRRAYSGSHTSTRSSPDERVAHTVLRRHELHAANVFLLDGLFACGVLV